MTDIDFQRTTVAELARQVSAKERSARSLTEHALAQIEALNPQIGAFVAVDPEAALSEAALLDDRLAAGHDIGPLAGIPIGVKDLEDAAGFRTTHGSIVHADDPVARIDSPLVERMRAAGCVVLGKTNTPEFGHKGDTDNPLFGATRNPWNLERSAGGSSGGAAAAVASGMVPLCTGSDGGGSIRIPAAVCGLSGLKPSLGRVPMGGANPPGWQFLSTRGPMARRIRDVTLALDAVVGPEATDLTALPMPDSSWTRSLADLHAPLRVGWSPTLGYARVDREVRETCERALSVLEDRGTEVIEIDSVFDEDPGLAWFTISSACNLRSLGHLEGSPMWDKIDESLRGTMEWAKSLSTTAVLQAQDLCHTYNLRLVDLFHRVPLLLTPTVAGQTGLVGGQGTIDGVEDVGWVSFTYPFNMTRSPAGTVCAGFTSDGMPVGLQIIGPQHADVAVLRAIALLEDGLGLDTVPPL